MIRPGLNDAESDMQEGDQVSSVAAFVMVKCFILFCACGTGRKQLCIVHRIVGRYFGYI